MPRGRQQTIQRREAERQPWRRLDTPTPVPLGRERRESRPADPSVIRNAFTVDVEDWYQGLEISPDGWNGRERRLSVGLSRLLRLLGEHGVKGTFFVLGRVAEESPGLVEEIAAQGHEIATHGYSHRIVYQQSRDEFARELDRALEVTERVTGQPVLGHRAAFFSITRRSLWATEVLISRGLRYDSSIFPVIHHRCGIRNAPRFPYELGRNGNGPVYEFPVSTVRLGGLNLPMSGGFYMRFLPTWMVKWGLRRVNREGQPAVVYVHPWELDPEHPRIRLPLKVRIPHYHRLRRTEDTLAEILSTFPFAPIRDLLHLS